MMRRFIAILLMLWFPVQGWAAFAMPFCQHAANVAKAAEALSQPEAEAVDHCQHHSEAPFQHSEAQFQYSEAPPAADHAADLAQCDHCTACHLAHTPMLTPLPLSLPCTAPAQRAENAAVFYYQLFPEQPQRPPLPLV